MVGEEPRRLEIPRASAYALEADALVRAAREGAAEVPGASPPRTPSARHGPWTPGARCLLPALPFEADTADVPTLTGRPLQAGSVHRRRGPHGLRQHPGVDKQVSRVS